MKRYLILFLILFSKTPSFASVQTNNALNPKLQIVANDTTKVKALLKLMFEYQNSSKETAIEKGHEALSLSKHLNWEIGTARVQEKLGRIYWDCGKYDSALYYHFRAAKQFHALNSWKDYWDVVVMIGQDYANSSKYELALFYLNAALNEYSSKNERGGESYVLGIISWVHGAKGDYELASKSTFEQLKIVEQTMDSNALTNVYFSLASHYINLKKFTEAETIIDKWYPIIKRSNITYALLDYYTYKGTLLYSANKLDSAIYFLKKEIEIAYQLKNDYWIADAFSSIGQIYYQKDKQDLAQLNFDSSLFHYRKYNQWSKIAYVNCLKTKSLIQAGKAIEAKQSIYEAEKYATQIGSNVSLFDYYQARLQYDSAVGNWKDAFVHLNSYKLFEDSIYNLNKTQQMLELQIRHDADKKENLLLEKNKFMRISLIILALFTLTVVLFFIQLFLKNREIKKSNRIKEAMIHEIHHRVKNNLQLISGFMQLNLSKTSDVKGREALEESITNIHVVSMVHDNLYSYSSDLVLLNPYLKNLCNNIGSITQSTQKPELILTCEDILLSIDQTIPIGLIINELITNSVKYAFELESSENKMELVIRQKEQQINLIYTDSGKGFKQAEQSRTSIGLRLIKMLVQELQGKYTLDGNGKFEFTLSFKLKKPSQKFEL